MEGLRRGQVVDAELATPGMATQLMMGEYTTAQTVARTPVRTPLAAKDKVAEEARAQAQAARLQTPLLGQASEMSLAEGDFEGTTPAPGVLATPNPLAAAAATPGQQGLGAATPGGATPGGLSGATPVQDALGINTPGSATPAGSRRAERARVQGARAGVRLGLGQLPEPHNKMALTGQESEVEGVEEGGQALDEEDAADRDARHQRALEDAKAHARALRSAVLRRELPRPAGAPATVAAAAVGAGGLTTAAYKAAEAILREEVAALIEHDNQRYGATGRSAKKRRRRLEALAEAGPSTMEREFRQEELAEAAGMVATEAEELRERYGHSSTSTASLVEMMQASYVEHECASSHGNSVLLTHSSQHLPAACG
jgi:hypothetical protein